MPSMTTEQRIASCFQRIQELETQRALIIGMSGSDEILILIDNQKEALRRLAEHLSGLLLAFPRPTQGASG